MKDHKFIQVLNKSYNATWIAGKTEAEWLSYAKTAFKEHPELKGKTEPQQDAYLKNVYKLAKDAVGSVPIQAEPTSEVVSTPAKTTNKKGE